LYNLYSSPNNIRLIKSKRIRSSGRLERGGETRNADKTLIANVLNEGRLKSSWTHFITPSRNFVECGDGLFFEVPPLASDALFTTLQPLLENVLQTVDHFEISCLGAPFSWSEESRNRTERDLDCVADVVMGFHLSTFSKPKTEFNSYFAPCDFRVFPTMKRELRGKEFPSDQRSAARFREVGGAL
jgi:hypothetical protein